MQKEENQCDLKTILGDIHLKTLAVEGPPWIVPATKETNALKIDRILRRDILNIPLFFTEFYSEIL